MERIVGVKYEKGIYKEIVVDGILDNITEQYDKVNFVRLVRCCECKYNNSCLTQSFVEDNGVIPFDRDTFFCADGERRNNE